MALNIRYSWQTADAAGTAVCVLAAPAPKSEVEIRAIEVEVTALAACRLNTDEVEVTIFDWRHVA